MSTDLSTVDTPAPERLTEDGLDAIHETSMEILKEIGIKVDHEEAFRLFVENGAEVNEDEQIVKLPRSLVEEHVANAPSSFTLHGRNPDQNVDVGNGSYALASGYGAPNILRFDDGRRRSTINDYEDLIKLAQLEDVISCTGYNLCEPNDVPQEVKHIEMVKRSLLFTDKPVMGSVYGEERAKESIELVGIANEDSSLEKPYMTGVINSVPPRQWDTKMTGGLLEYARHGQPTLISAVIMANASGPSTIAGSLALANAEILTGITLTQLVNSGVPVVYGLPASNVDVRYGSFTIGSPEGALFVSFAGQMGQYYDIPSRAGGCLSDAKTVDDQSGAESMMQMLITMNSDINFVLHAAGILDSYSTVSPEKFVLDCERIRYLERFADGYDLSDESFATDLIADVEPGGHFLNQQHTLTHCKTDHYFPEIYEKQSYDDWEDDGEKDAFEQAHERVKDLLNDYDRPPMATEIETAIEEYVEEHKRMILEE